MKELFLSEGELDERRKQLPERLKQYLPDPPHFAASFTSLDQYTKVIGIHQGVNRGPDYTSWRVSLAGKQIAIGYYEVWLYEKSRGMAVRYLLNKAYLHVFVPHSAGDEMPLVYLHCDPQERESSEHYRYKVAPHAHFEIAGNPWSDIHVPLCDGRQDEVLSSLACLDQAIERAVEFVVQQLCPVTGKLDLAKAFRTR